MIAEYCEHNSVDDDKLKPCPFCGADVYMSIEDWYDEFTSLTHQYWVIVCAECDMHVTTDHDCSLEMAEWWNTRNKRNKGK